MALFTFQLTQQQIDLVAAGLAELPFKQVQPLLVELQRQFEQQRAVAEAPPEQVP